MGLFKLKKNKKFSYKPRYFDDKGQGNPYKIKHKFDDFRTTVGPNTGLKTKIINAINEFKGIDESKANLRVVLISAVLIFVFLVFIEFDLTIFFLK